MKSRRCYELETQIQISTRCVVYVYYDRRFSAWRHAFDVISRRPLQRDSDRFPDRCIARASSLLRSRTNCFLSVFETPNHDMYASRTMLKTIVASSSSAVLARRSALALVNSACRRHYTEDASASSQLLEQERVQKVCCYI